jgi:hypothetical protein
MKVEHLIAGDAQQEGVTVKLFREFPGGQQRLDLIYNALAEAGIQ